MGAFFGNRRNQAIIAAVVFIALLFGLLLLRLGFGGKKISTDTSTGSATVSPSPSVSDSPSPEPSPTPPAPSPSPAPATPPPSPAASAAAPGSTPPALTNAGHELNPPASAIDRFGSGGPCTDAWKDPGWTIDPGDCGILAIRNANQDGSVAFIIEHQPAGANTARRVYLMTGDSTWHVRLSATDDSGVRFDKIDVHKATVAGDTPEVVVGFRINGTGHFLTYDIVEMRALAGPLEVAASRNLDHGSANIESGDIVDYTPYPNASTPDYFIRSVIGFSGGAFRITSSTHAPERGPGNVAPPP